MDEVKKFIFNNIFFFLIFCLFFLLLPYLKPTVGIDFISKTLHVDSKTVRFFFFFFFFFKKKNYKNKNKIITLGHSRIRKIQKLNTKLRSGLGRRYNSL